MHFILLMSNLRDKQVKAKRKVKSNPQVVSLYYCNVINDVTNYSFQFERNLPNNVVY